MLKGNVSNRSATKITLATATFSFSTRKVARSARLSPPWITWKQISPGPSESEILQEGVASAKFAGFTAK